MSITWGVDQIIRVFPRFSLGFLEPLPWDLGNPRCAPSRRTTHRETPRRAILAVSPWKWSDPMVTQSFLKVAEEFPPPKKQIHDIISNLTMKISMMTKVRNIWQVLNLKNIFRELGGNIFNLRNCFLFWTSDLRVSVLRNHQYLRLPISQGLVAAYDSKVPQKHEK